MDIYRTKASEYFEQNKFADAVNFFQLEAAYLQRTGKLEEYLTCRLWENHFRIILGEYREVLRELPALRNLYRQLLEADNTALASLYWYILANASYYLGEYIDAAAFGRKAQDCLEKANISDSIIRAEIAMIVGKASWRLGDLVEAFTILIRAARQAVDAAATPYYIVGKIINLIAVVAMDMGKIRAAFKLLQQVIDLYRRSRSQLPENHPYFGILYNDLALCYLRSEDQDFPDRVQLANEYATKAESIFWDLFPDGAYRYKAFVLKVKARVIKESGGDYQQIIKALDEKIEMRKRAYNTDRHASIARAYNQQARACVRAEKLELGLKKAHAALIASSHKFSDEDEWSFPSFPGNNGQQFEPEMLKAVHNKAELFLKLYRKYQTTKYLRGAFLAVVAATDLIQHFKSSFRTEEARLILVAKSRPIHLIGINILWEVFKRQENGEQPIEGLDYSSIFTRLQFTKSSLLLGSMVSEQDIDVDTLLSLPGEELFNLEQLLNELCELLDNIFSLTAPSQSVSKDFSDFEERVLFFFGRRRDLTEAFLLEEELNDVTKTYDIDAVNQGFDNGKNAIISYFVGDDSLFGICLKNNDFQIRRLLHGKAQLKQFGADVNELKDILDHKISNYIRNEHHTLREYTDPKPVFSQLAFECYQKLVLPFSLEGITQLYIIPDDFLWSIPFEAFITEAPDELNPLPYHHMKYLHHQFVIGYHFSIPLLCKMHHPENSTKPGRIDSFLAAIGYIKAQNKSDTIDLIKSWVKEFGDKGVDQSVLYEQEKVGLPTATFLKLMRPFDVVYFHAQGGIQKKEYGLIPAIQMSDRLFLKASDLRTGPDLNCQLLILHSCFSGAGPIRKGEGAMALSRTFVKKGAKNVICSLFRISEYATKAMINLLFVIMLDEHNKPTIAQALNKTKESLSKNENYNPGDWAGLAFIGNQQEMIIVEALD